MRELTVVEVRLDAEQGSPALILKEVGGERKEHRFIRADRHASHEAAVSFTLDKARQIIDLQGDRMFE